MDPLTLSLIFGGLLLWGAAKRDGAEPLPDVGPPDEQEPNGKEPIFKPGPVDIPEKPKVKPIPANGAAAEKEYLAKVDNLISLTPIEGHFFQIRDGGPNAVGIAKQVLGAKGVNTGSNRIRFFKCLTQIPWNARLYSSAHMSKSYGTLYDVGDQNLSAMWLPRNASAKAFLAMHQMPPRTIGPAGQWEGGGLEGQASFYGLLWIPKVRVANEIVVCEPLADDIPGWLTKELQ